MVFFHLHIKKEVFFSASRWHHTPFEHDSFSFHFLLNMFMLSDLKGKQWSGCRSVSISRRSRIAAAEGGCVGGRELLCWTSSPPFKTILSLFFLSCTEVLEQGWENKGKERFRENRVVVSDASVQMCRHNMQTKQNKRGRSRVGGLTTKQVVPEEGVWMPWCKTAFHYCPDGLEAPQQKDLGLVVQAQRNSNSMFSNNERGTLKSSVSWERDWK